MTVIEKFVCNLEEEIRAIAGETVDLTEINSKIAKNESDIASLGTRVDTAQTTANTAKTTADAAKISVDNMQNLIDSVYTSISQLGLFWQPGYRMSGQSMTDADSYSNNVFYAEGTSADSATRDGIYIPHGAYSVIVRGKVPSLPATATTCLVVNVYYQDNNTTGLGTLLKSMTIKTSNFSKANTYECLSFGCDFVKPADYTGVDPKFCVELKHLASHTTVYVDYVRIIPAGTALGSIG